MTLEKNDDLNRYSQCGADLLETGAKETKGTNNESPDEKITSSSYEYWENVCGSKRLSDVAGSILTDNNPNITDLNDPNRPTKLAEKLGKIYDDEWTDAVQNLEHKKSKKKEKKHEKIVYHLYSLIKVLYVTCKQKAEEQVGHFLLLKDPSQYQVEASWTEIPVESRESFTENRKKIAGAYIEMLQKIIKDDDIYKKEICSLSPSLEYLQNSLYFKKCLEICWYFVIQDPPLYLDIRPLEGNLLNKDTHKE